MKLLPQDSKGKRYILAGADLKWMKIGICTVEGTDDLYPCIQMYYPPEAFQYALRVCHKAEALGQFPTVHYWKVGNGWDVSVQFHLKLTPNDLLRDLPDSDIYQNMKGLYNMDIELLMLAQAGLPNADVQEFLIFYRHMGYFRLFLVDAEGHTEWVIKLTSFKYGAPDLKP